MNVINISQYFTFLVSSKYSSGPAANVSEEEKLIASQLFEYVEFIFGISINPQPFLLDDENDGIEEDAEVKEQEEFVETDQHDIAGQRWTMSEMRQLVQYVEEHPGHQFKTVQHRFRHLKNQRSITRIYEIVAN